MEAETEVVRIAVVGAGGRMGREVLRSLGPRDGFQIVAAVDRSHGGVHCREVAGQDAPDIAIQDKLGAALDQAKPDVLVDLSHHSAAAAHAGSAIKRNVSPIIGCTGVSDADLKEIRIQSQEAGVPGMYVPNFAIGAVLMMHFAKAAARWLPDAEIVELHHDRKEDAPSGTALLTAEIIGDARREEPTRKPRATIKVEGVRGGKAHDVNIHSVRLPGLVAHQVVMFGGQGEILTIRHDSFDRTSFMQGVKICAKAVRSLEGFVVGLDKILFS